MAGGRLISTIILVLISVHVSRCGHVDNMLQVIALPELGKIGHNSASSAASAASSAYGDLRAYLDNFRDGFGLPEFPPRSIFERFPLLLTSESNSRASAGNAPATQKS